MRGKWKFSSNSSHARNIFSLSTVIQKLYQAQPDHIKIFNYKILCNYEQSLWMFLHEVQLKTHIPVLKNSCCLW